MIFKYWNDYPINQEGVVFNKNGSIKPHWPNRKGYPTMGFMLDGKLKTVAVHRVIAEVFMGECPDGYQVDHIDNNRMNFHPSNLRYVTASENVKKAYDEGRKDHSGFKAAASKYTGAQLLSAIQMIKDGFKNKEIVLKLQIGNGTVKNLRSGRHFFCKEGYGLG